MKHTKLMLKFSDNIEVFKIKKYIMELKLLKVSKLSFISLKLP